VIVYVWQMRSLRLRLNSDKLLDADYLQVLGFSKNTDARA
jgi:hypothetical protein